MKEQAAIESLLNTFGDIYTMADELATALSNMKHEAPTLTERLRIKRRIQFLVSYLRIAEDDADILLEEYSQ